MLESSRAEAQSAKCDSNPTRVEFVIPIKVISELNQDMFPILSTSFIGLHQTARILLDPEQDTNKRGQSGDDKTATTLSLSLSFSQIAADDDDPPPPSPPP